MAHRFEVVEGPEVKNKVAELASENPELVEGYMIIAVRVDGSMVIGHNACCARGMLANIWHYVQDNPGMDVPNPTLVCVHQS